MSHPQAHINEAVESLNDIVANAQKKLRDLTMLTDDDYRI